MERYEELEIMDLREARERQAYMKEIRRKRIALKKKAEAKAKRKAERQEMLIGMTSLVALGSAFVTIVNKVY